MMKSIAEYQHFVWKFNTPSTPNIGGTFESGMKAA